MPSKTFKHKINKSKSKNKNNKSIKRNRKTRSIVRKMRGGGGINVANNTIIGSGSFGCAFKTGDNIIKLAKNTVNTQHELNINKILLEEQKKNPEIINYFSIITRYAIYDKDLNWQEGNYEFDLDKITKYKTNCSNAGLDLFNIQLLLLEMPNAGESLETYITNLLKSGKENKVIIGEIIDCINKSLQALKILHSFKIIHNDLKLDNICINKKKECRIIDFGTSILYDPTSIYKKTGINAPDYIFLVLDKDYIFNFKRHLHIYSSDEFKEQLILCAKNMPTEEKKYKKNKDNYFKMDLYFFGCMLDNLLYERVAYNGKDYSFKPKIDCDELKPGGILYEFIVSISNLDYKKRKLLYEIKKQTWLGRLFS